MTFTVLRQLHSIIGDALDDIERVYAEASPSPVTSDPPTPWSSPSLPSCNSSKPMFGNGYASPPPSPPTSTFPKMHDPVSVSIDFPSLDSPYDPNSPSESLTAHPEVFSAINRIVAACGQMSVTVQPPFLTICDATMAYHLPSCMRLFEASHTPEILKKAGPNGMHVKDIAEENGVDATKLAHILRLLCVHHLVREISPNVFANNRVSSMIDSGKSVEELKERPEKKYENSNGIAAFVGLCTDELQKSSAFLTEAYFLSPKAHLNGKEPTRAPFNYAFGCEGVDFFGWLEGEGIQGNRVNGRARSESIRLPGMLPQPSTGQVDKSDHVKGINDLITTMTNYTIGPTQNPNQFRLERFGIAMAGTDSWEVPGAILNGFDWQSLPRGSLVVDVGGGIGPTMMLLAHAFSRPGDEDAMDLRFIIQDRQVVVDMGEKAWRAKCPEYLDLGIAKFQVHDFFTPQPIKKPAVFFLRVVLHDWPTDYARMILLHLREAASPDTKLLIADFIIPLACRDNFGSHSHSTEDGDSIEGITGAENLLAPTPLLPNLGKASANVYWMDLTMQVTFNGQERTLREIVALTRSAGWRVTRVVKAPGSHFGHITAVPTDIPLQSCPPASVPSDGLKAENSSSGTLTILPQILKRSMSRCETPTFGSKRILPSFEDVKAKNRFGFGYTKMSEKLNIETLKPAPNVAVPRKRRTSLLSVQKSSPPAPLRTNALSPSQSQPLIKRRPSLAHMSQHRSQCHQESPVPTSMTSPRVPPPSPLSVRVPMSPPSRRPSLANLSLTAAFQSSPSMIPIRQPSEFSIATAATPPSPTVSRPKLPQRRSTAQLSPALKRSESAIINHSSSLMRTRDHPDDVVPGTYTRRALDFSDTHGNEEAAQLEDDSRGTNCSLLAAAVQIKKGYIA